MDRLTRALLILRLNLALGLGHACGRRGRQRGSVSMEQLWVTLGLMAVAAVVTAAVTKSIDLHIGDLW